MILQSNPTEVCEFGAKIQRESAYYETKGEWIFGLENLSKILNNSDALVSYILNSMSKIVERQQNNSRSGERNETLSFSCVLYRHYIYICLCSKQITVFKNREQTG